MRTMDWNDWHTYAAVAQLGSFTRAAERLNLPKSSVSLAVSRLERRLGQRLIERSTRQLRLTEAGQRLLDDIRPLFEELEHIANGAAAHADLPQGKLRIAAPYEFGTLQMGNVVCRVLARYPKLDIDVDVIGRLVDPLTEGYDLTFAVTAQPLPDSSRVAKRVFSVNRGIYASPALIRERGEPQDIAALADWPVIATTQDSEWGFTDATGKRHVLPLRPRLHTVNAGLRLQAVVAGLGISLVADHFCDAELAAGQVQRLLSDYTPDPLRVYALMPARRLTPAKVRVFLDELERWLAPGVTA